VFLPKIKVFLKKRGLEISESKTKILNLEFDTLEYLGWTLTFYRKDFRNRVKGESVLIIKPTKKALQKVKMKMRLIFNANMPMEGTIRKLNPIIRGWTNYYNISFHSQKAFAHLSQYQYILW
jgi:hypothetical protein